MMQNDDQVDIAGDQASATQFASKHESPHDQITVSQKDQIPIQMESATLLSPISEWPAGSRHTQHAMQYNV